MKKMKKIIASILVLAMLFSLSACGNTNSNKTAQNNSTNSSGSTTSNSNSNNKKIKIGVSIWSSTDVLGSQCKKMLDEAANALGIELMYVDQGHISEKVTASVKTLAAAGCQGIIICNSADSEMASAIQTADQYHVYLAQFFRMISKDRSPQIYEQAQKSKYFVGAVHEDEVVNGYNLVNILINKGKRFIGLIGWNPGDATFLLRWEGYKKAVDQWNQNHPDDKVFMTQPVYAGTTADGGASSATSLMNSYPKMDALIVAGGGGDPLVGALNAIKNAGKTGKIGVVSTDFLPDLGQELQSGAMTAESGGHFADPLFALMMVYNAIRGNYVKPDNSFYEIKFPYLYVSSPSEYNDYQKYFVDSLPYNTEELKAMANDSFQQLAEQALNLSIDDVKKRHGSQ